MIIPEVGKFDQLPCDQIMRRMRQRKRSDRCNYRDRCRRPQCDHPQGLVLPAPLGLRERCLWINPAWSTPSSVTNDHLWGLVTFAALATGFCLRIDAMLDWTPPQLYLLKLYYKLERAYRGWRILWRLELSLKRTCLWSILSQGSSLSDLIHWYEPVRKCALERCKGLLWRGLIDSCHIRWDRAMTSYAGIPSRLISGACYVSLSWVIADSMHTVCCHLVDSTSKYWNNISRVC